MRVGTGVLRRGSRSDDRAWGALLWGMMGPVGWAIMGLTLLWDAWNWFKGDDDTEKGNG
jgi:hypothetical protein